MSSTRVPLHDLLPYLHSYKASYVTTNLNDSNLSMTKLLDAYLLIDNELLISEQILSYPTCSSC